MPAIVCTAKASCKKLPGTLELTDTHLQWTQEGKKAPSIRVAYAEANSLFCSKENAPQVRLKIAPVGNDAGHNFTFTSPQPIAYQERERFKKELTAIIARNKAVTPNAPTLALSLPGGPATPIPSLPSTPLPLTNGGATPKLSAAVLPSRPATSRAASVAASDRRGTPAITGNDPATDFRLRKRVLMNNPELGTLHRELVMTGQISEAEFWDGREHLLLAQAASESQRRGKPGQLVDPRPETVEGGEIKIRITPQLVHDIFDEYPVVARAYSENVPQNLTEAEFWKRYFQSKLFNAHRASIRSSATQHVVKEDPILDKYLEKDDDGIEPRRQRSEKPELFLDLGATSEDHGELTVERDITMQAGRQKGAIPLIRKFNEHSERLLNSALGDLPPSKRRRLDEEYSQIEIDDLRDEGSSNGIVLEMQDRERYFEGSMAGNANKGNVNGTPLDPRAIVWEAKNSLNDWEKNLSQLKIDRKPGDSALLSMTQNVAARLDVRSRKNDIPAGLFREMTTCQTAANEFLRQYWSATLPQPPELQTAATATPAQRASKAVKMIGYLSKTPEKVQALVDTATASGLDASRVEVAMKPVLDAVNHALVFHRNKEAAAAVRRGR
ncbi:hypothetical protein EST38_g827 [Candolleomyces aberdarensis]|uniref:BSD domain-containing protein n=1 Tax=Candolleomyces aberdarensis TaxID=2316362 RepID=A0A4Q2DZ37_9AGAR|nr:hypothetical protein EST38_g827 [Candolleomyces aberdarensis]